MSLFAPVRSHKLPHYITLLILLLNLHFPLNSHCSRYSVKQPVLDNRRRSVQSAPTPNYFRQGGGGEEDDGVTISSVGYEESLPSEYNVHESRESGKSYEYPGSEEMELPAAALENAAEDLAESAHLKQKRPKTQRDLLLEELFSNYKTHERPTEMLETPTVVKVNMKVLAIFSVDVRTMDYYLDALLRQTWIDPRLSWNTTAGFRNYTQPLVAPRLKEMLWLPDLFFRNGKDGYLHKMTLPNYLLRVYPDGSVLYSQKITMRFACQMDLQTFPMDTQRCDINIGSYGYTLSELKFVWRETAAVELPEKLQISEFNTPKNFTTLDCTSVANTSTGAYTCLLAKFTLQRQLGSYLVTTYIPNILIIMVSFLSFWVNVDAAPARVPLGLLSLLGLLTQASSMTTSLPRVSYIKALDLWLIFSIIFVICVLVEYAFAITMLRRKRKAIWRMDVRQIVREELVRWSAACQQHAAKGADAPRGQADFYTEVESFLCINSEQEKKKKAATTTTTKTTKGGREPPESEIDSYSRFIFPLCYVMYNMFYWLYYLVIVKQTEEPD